MKKISVLFAAMLIAQGVGAQKAWTLDECLNYALEHNITLQKARLSAKSAAEDVKGARADLLPSVSASTNQSFGYRQWHDNSNQRSGELEGGQELL